MTAYTLHTIAAAMHGTIVQEAGDPSGIEHLCTDSRRAVHAATSIFFALETPHRNGHAYIAAAYTRGIRSFVIHQETDYTAFPEAGFILVPNTLTALQQLAAWHRQQLSVRPDGSPLPVIGITGSNGKTIVKEWLYQLLHEQWKVVRSPKSYNSQIGVPLSVWQLQPEHELALFEAGISQKGEMEALANIIQPTIGVFTNLGDAHQEGFADNPEKFREKAVLFRQCDTVIYSPEQTGYTFPEKTGTTFITWGSGTGCTLQLLQAEQQGTSTLLRLRWNDHSFGLSLPFTDPASVQNVLACTCVCLHLGMSPDLLQEKVEHLKPVSLRLELKKGQHNCTLINDSYSADLHSFEIALNLLQQQRLHKHRTVILSDLPVAESQQEETYLQLAKQLISYQVQRVICVGTSAQQHLTRLLPSGCSLLSYSHTDQLLHELNSIPFSNEAILIKGARSFELDRLVPLLEQQVHETVLEINLSALSRNYKAIQQPLNPGVKMMAVVKAFSYGAGSYEIANLLQHLGADYLAVAFADEGVELRRAGISLPIMIMNAEQVSFDALTTYGLEPELYSFGMLDAFEQHLLQEGIESYPVHIKIDTGMHRLGFAQEEWPELCARLKKASTFSIQSVFSHLVASEAPAFDTYTNEQAQLFEQACTQLHAATGQTFLRHISNTGGILRHPQLQYEMVRLGIGLYGIGTAGSSASLENVVSLKTTIAQLKTLQPGDTVGYNRAGVVNRPSVIATVRIGYADGYPRNLSNGQGFMLVHGQPAPVIGTVCMDMTMLDVTDIPHVKEGDPVEVFGTHLPLQQLAKMAGTIPYELMTGISQRVKRVYFEE